VFLIEPYLWRYAAYRAYLNLVGEAARYYLAWLWWFLEPIAMTGVFFLVFTYLRASNAENFQYFLIIVFTSWLWFANGVANSTDSLRVAKAMISPRPLPKLLFPLTSVISASLKHAFVFAIVLIVIAAMLGPSSAWLYLPVLLATQFALTLAVGVTVAFVCCWIRDLTFVIRSGLLLMMFCSGIFFAVERMPPAYQEIFRLNPMALLIEDYRTVLLEGVVPEVLPCLRIAAVSVIWLYLMKRAYTRWDLTLTRHVLA